MNTNLYETDFYQWIQETALLLKDKRFSEIDLENLIEEIEAMGRSELKELKSRLITIIEHLLKCLYWLQEKEQNQRGWHNTIIEQRKQIYLLFSNSPSLKNKTEEIYFSCAEMGKKTFFLKTNLPAYIIPNELPFQLEQVLEENYLP